MESVIYIRIDSISKEELGKEAKKRGLKVGPYCRMVLLEFLQSKGNRKRKGEWK